MNSLPLYLLATGGILNALAVWALCRDAKRQDRMMRTLTEDVDLDATVHDMDIAAIEKRLDAIEAARRYTITTN
jgi:hypothetical protein